jgi:hypothetical protein
LAMWSSEWRIADCSATMTGGHCWKLNAPPMQRAHFALNCSHIPGPKCKKSAVQCRSHRPFWGSNYSFRNANCAGEITSEGAQEKQLYMSANLWGEERVKTVHQLLNN